MDKKFDWALKYDPKKEFSGPAEYGKYIMAATLTTITGTIGVNTEVNTEKDNIIIALVAAYSTIKNYMKKIGIEAIININDIDINNPPMSTIN
jgi:hypothetical protein